jgi:hypothetical protein
MVGRGRGEDSVGAPPAAGVEGGESGGGCPKVSIQIAYVN